MSDPRGAAGGSATDTGPALPHPATPTGETSVGRRTPAADAPTVDEHDVAVSESAVDADTRAEPSLDASVHAHVFDDPLPPVDDEADPPLFAATRGPRDGASEAGSADSTAVLPAVLPAGLPAVDAENDPDVADGATGAPDPDDAAGRTAARHTLETPHVPLRRRRWFRVAVGTTVGLALLGSAGLATYLYASATGWREHADDYLGQSRDLAEELSTTRGDLAGAQAELQAVRDQLATAHERITELASEKAQISDEWELTQQIVDYQERVSDAAGQVALALDQCVQSQQQLIGYLARAAEESAENATTGPTTAPPPYDPDQLAQFEADVEAFCQAASEANISLQQELAR